MEHDYSVTWNEVKPLIDKELERRGVNGETKIPIAVIRFALDNVWNQLYEKMAKEYGDIT